MFSIYPSRCPWACQYLLRSLLLILQLPTLLNDPCNLITNLRPQPFKTLDNTLPIPLSHLLTHLELALQLGNLDLNPNNVPLQQLNILLWRIRHLPLAWSLATRIPHRVSLIMIRKITNRLSQKRRRLFIVLIVNPRLSINLRRGVIPR